MSNTVKGTINWFNESKALGFIEQSSGPDVFTHFSEIQSSGFKSLNERQQLEFVITQVQKGPQAKKTVVI